MMPGQIGFLINGIGAMGRGLAYQLKVTPGTACLGLSDIDAGRAIACATWLGLDYRVVSTPAEANAAIADGKVAIANDGAILARCGRGDVVFEASSAIGDAARLVMDALMHDKHVVMMNAEADFAYGPLLANKAEERGLLYSSVDGDQYGVLKRLADQATAWGFDLVMFGNIKGFLDRRGNPHTIAAEADKRNLDHRMCAAYTDGTKLNIEMALIANALGGRPVRAGMLGPRAVNVGEVLNLFPFAELWDGRTPLVDYILGAEPGGGVYLVGHCADPYQRDMLRYYKMGNGPFYLFYRPYHLCHIEAVAAAMEMLRTRVPLMRPVRYDTEVYAYAKTPLPAGTRLDGIGGFHCYGLIDSRQPLGGGLPICLAHNARLVRAKECDEPITMDDVIFDDRRDADLYWASRAVADRSETN